MDGTVLAHRFFGDQHFADLIQVPTLPNGLLDTDLRGKQQHWNGWGRDQNGINGWGENKLYFMVYDFDLHNIKKMNHGSWRFLFVFKYLLCNSLHFSCTI